MSKLIVWTEKAALAVCASAVFIMMAVGAIDIVMGNVLGFYLSYKVELSGTLLASSIFLACSPVQRGNEHIRVDLFESFMGDKTKKATTLLGTLCGLLFVGLITYGLWHQAIKSVMIWEVSADTSGFPIWPWKLACPIGATLCVLTMIGQLLQQVFNSSTSKESQ
jgi:TRAP-type mannitol/chloroaromatic compound transport system permease small subunit